MVGVLLPFHAHCCFGVPFPFQRKKNTMCGCSHLQCQTHLCMRTQAILFIQTLTQQRHTLHCRESSSLKVYSPILPFINIKTKARAQLPFTVPVHCAFQDTVIGLDAEQNIKLEQNCYCITCIIIILQYPNKQLLLIVFPFPMRAVVA